MQEQINIQQALEILSRSRLHAESLINKNSQESVLNYALLSLKKTIINQIDLAGKLETNIRDADEHEQIKIGTPLNKLFINTVVLSPSEANQISSLLMQLINKPTP